MGNFGRSMFTLRIFRSQPLTDSTVTLRPAVFSDACTLHAGFSSEDLLTAAGLRQPAARSKFLFWWWLRRTFVFAYCIEVNKIPCGFLGLHSLHPGDSAEISLAIFDTGMRRQRIGSRAFYLFAGSPEKKAIAEKLLVRVRQDNKAALAFWRKLGFKQVKDLGSIRLFAHAVNGSPELK